jgi:polyferredoxin
VAVCPTGIDIRKGLQLECIACTQCIDACDGVMQRIARPAGLIGYRSLAGLEGRAARLLRPRTAVYGLLLAVVVAAFVVQLARRLPMDLYVAHAGGALVTHAADGREGNAFTLHITNRSLAPQSYRVALEDGAGLELVAGMNPIPVAAASSLETRVFVLARAGLASREIRFVLEPEQGGARVVRSAHLMIGEGGEGDADEHRAGHDARDG